MLDANFGGGDQLAIYPYLDTYPDFTLSFSPASLTIPAGNSAPLSITATSTSPAIPDYCSPATIAKSSYEGQATAPAPFVSSSAVSLCPSQSAATSVSVPANVPSGNYELTVSSTLIGTYEPCY